MDRPVIATGVRATSIQQQDIPSLLLQRVARLRPKVQITSQFLLLLLQGNLFAEYIAPIFTGVSVPHLSPEQIRGFKIMLPPLEEQREITAFIGTETGTVTGAINRYEREITLMREYRTRLVADVVTGKLDVREAALLLTEEDVVLASEDVVDETDEPELEEGGG